MLNLSSLPCTNQGHRKDPCYLKPRAAITITMPDHQSSLTGPLSSWSPFQKSESIEEPVIRQHVSSPLFKKFGIAFQDSAEETTLVRPLHSNLEAADSYGPYPSSLFYDECLCSDVCPPAKLGSPLENRGEEPAIHQHVSSPLYQKFGIPFQDSAEETTLVRPHHSNLKAATGSNGYKKKSRKEINRDYYLKNKNKKAEIKRIKNKSAVKKYQVKANPAKKRNNLKSAKKYQATNPLYKAEHLEAVKRNQATNPLYKAENLEAVKRNQATNLLYKAEHLEAVKRNQNKNPDHRSNNHKAAKKYKAKTRDMLVANKNKLAPTREEYDKNDNGVVPSG